MLGLSTQGTQTQQGTSGASGSRPVQLRRTVSQNNVSRDIKTYKSLMTKIQGDFDGSLLSKYKMNSQVQNVYYDNYKTINNATDDEIASIMKQESLRTCIDNSEISLPQKTSTILGALNAIRNPAPQANVRRGHHGNSATQWAQDDDNSSTQSQPPKREKGCCSVM